MTLVKVLLILSMVSLTSSKVYYIDEKIGSDTNQGDSIVEPFATIQKCVDTVENPGDECRIRKGIRKSILY